MRVFREIEIAAREFILEGGKRAGSMKRAEANAAVAEMSAFASLAFPSSDSVLPSAELRQRAWEVGVRGWLRAADDALAHPQAWGRTSEPGS